jgi:Co/Zn/Cd efflux system component
VVILNVGFGIIEMIGGFISGSQALKADALDFIGDGAITFLGILAIGWSFVWRSRSALIQGLFLAALGIGVVGNTIYQISAGQSIDAPIMGVVAFVALLVNVAAAFVLIPHRSGDTNMQAVWLFSRNDAIGNAAVVFAAVVVALSGSGWPDLIVAFAIAGLFLHSAFIIIRDALKEL